jgi:hypothetical protein
MKKYNPSLSLNAGPVSAKDFFSLLWPYQMRERGPDKEYSPNQIFHILKSGVDSMFARVGINIANSGMTALVRVTIPKSNAPSVMEKINSMLESSPEDYCLKKYTDPSGKDYILVADMPSWIALYKAGILSFDYKYEDLNTELIEVLLERGY